MSKVFTAYFFLDINFFGFIRKLFILLPVISQPCSEFRFITCWLLLSLFYISLPKVEFLFGWIVFPLGVLGIVQQNYMVSSPSLIMKRDDHALSDRVDSGFLLATSSGNTKNSFTFLFTESVVLGK